MTELLRATDLHKSYHDGTRELQVLRGAALTVAPGESVAIIGMSGSGKSTMMHLLGGLDVPDRGTIEFEGETITGMSLSRLHAFRNRKVGFVFQFHHLLPEFNALENIMMPALMAGTPRTEAEARARESLERLGLADRARHRPAKLSGGEQQRVALARALANQPRLLLADEPTGNLDRHTGEAVIDLMWRELADHGRGLVIVTHEAVIAARADRVLRLFEGTLHPVDHGELDSLMNITTG